MPIALRVHTLPQGRTDRAIAESAIVLLLFKGYYIKSLLRIIEVNGRHWLFSAGGNLRLTLPAFVLVAGAAGAVNQREGMIASPPRAYYKVRRWFCRKGFCRSAEALGSSS